MSEQKSPYPMQDSDVPPSKKFGPGTQQEIEHLSGQIDALIDERAETVQHDGREQTFDAVLSEHWVMPGRGYLAGRVLSPGDFKPGDKVRIQVILLERRP